MFVIENSWKQKLEQEIGQVIFLQMAEKMEKEYDEYTVFPEAKDIFHAFEATPFEDVKVVIIGQDPYHNEDRKSVV